MEQGAFSELRGAGSYIQSLNIAEDSHSDTEDDESSAAGKADGQSEADKPAEDIKKEEEERIQSSDRGTFKYYLESARWINHGISAMYIILQGLLIMLRCKSWRHCLGWREEEANCLSDVWITWWGDATFRPSGDVGFWLGIYGFLSISEPIFIGLAIMSVLHDSRLRYMFSLTANQASPDLYWPGERANPPRPIVNRGDEVSVRHPLMQPS